MGKRQRHSEFVRVSDDELRRVAADKNEPTDRRRKAVAELKFRRKRNIQKRQK